MHIILRNFDHGNNALVAASDRSLADHRRSTFDTAQSLIIIKDLVRNYFLRHLSHIHAFKHVI